MLIPQREPHITIRAVQPVVAGLDALGHDAKRIVESAGINFETLADPEGRVPHSKMMTFWKKAEEATGDDNLGLHLAQAAPIASFEVHAYAVLSSPTLRDAYRRASRYQRLIHEITDLVFDEGNEQGVLRHTLPNGQTVPRHPAEFLVTLWIRFGRLVTGRDWAPAAVYFSHRAPDGRSEHERLYGAPVIFSSGKTALHISNQILDMANPKADAGLIAVLDRYAQTQIGQAQRCSTFAECVRSQLAASLADGAPGVEELARAMHVSVRTFNRRLKAEGTGYRQLLEGTRHERAITLLSDSRYSIIEIAFMLGFADVASFYKYFKRWTGTTPLNFRAPKQE